MKGGGRNGLSHAASQTKTTLPNLLTSSRERDRCCPPPTRHILNVKKKQLVWSIMMYEVEEEEKKAMLIHLSQSFGHIKVCRLQNGNKFAAVAVWSGTEEGKKLGFRIFNIGGKKNQKKFFFL